MKKCNWFGLFNLACVNLFHRVLLDRFQYCHVRDVRTGITRLREGPARVWPGFFGEVVSGVVQQKIVLPDGNYVIVHNPYDPQKRDILEGERDVRIGPAVFSLYPGEFLDQAGVEEVIVLTDDDALLVRAVKKAPHPTKEGEWIEPGTEVLVRGFRRYVPHKDIEIVEERKSLSLSKDAGVYVQNNDTGAVCLVRGECDLFLEQNESLWSKLLTREEKEALGYVQQSVGRDTRVLVASPRARDEFSAVVVDLEVHQAICLQSSVGSRVEFGPATVFLEPHERPRVLCLSGGVPVVPNVLKVAVLDLGPDFILDRISGVRTKDNARLTLDVKLHWRFNVVSENPEKLFELKDPIGFAVGVVSSRIREVVASHDFEEFHSKAAELVAKAILTGEKGSCYFSENGFEVFGIDIVGVSADDPEIQKKLTDAIKATVDVYTNRVREEAKLASEFRILEGQKKNEEARKELIEKTVANERLQELERAKTNRLAAVEKAEGEAEALRIKAEAEQGAEERRLALLTATLSGEGGERYLTLEQARVLRATDKVVVPTGSQLRLSVGGE